MTRYPARTLATLTALVVAGGLTSVSPSVAAAADDRTSARANSTWLHAQLDDGRYTNPLGGGDDEGLMIDALYAMHASGDAELAEPIVDVLDHQDGVLNYISWNEWWPGEGADERIGGATAKTLLAAQVAGADPHDFGGLDLVEETKDVIIKAEDFEPGGRFAPDGAFPSSGNVAADAGRVTDYGPNQNFNNANTFGQILATIALARAGELTQPVVDALLWQQCPEGYFRIYYSTNNVTSERENCEQGQETPAWEPDNPNPPMVNASPPDGDTTGFGLSALLAARAAGFDGLDDDINRAVAWLVDNQDTGGGWGGGVGTEAPNTNSTGLIVQALADAGADAGVIADGAAYLRSAQATEAADSGNALAGDIGAIAYQPEDYETARTGGIGNLDTWIRAGAQASLGLSQVGFWELSAGPRLPGADFAVTTPSGFQLAGSRVRVRATGLAPEEAYTLRLAGRTVGTGTAGPGGRAEARVRVPRGLSDGRYRAVVAGSTPSRSGSSQVRVLARRAVSLSRSRSRVPSGGKVRFTVGRLAAGEPVTLRVGGQVRRGEASPDGRFVRRVKVRGSGAVQVRARGAFAVRHATTSVRVSR